MLLSRGNQIKLTPKQESGWEDYFHTRIHRDVHLDTTRNLRSRSAPPITSKIRDTKNKISSEFVTRTSPGDIFKREIQGSNMLPGPESRKRYQYPKFPKGTMYPATWGPNASSHSRYRPSDGSETRGRPRE